MNKKQKSLTNKGFSLVELIIVIAIMAVLVGVLAPQFLKYVERSRKSTDCQNAASIVTALQTYAVDPMVTTNKLADGATVVLKSGATAGVDDTDICSGNANAALKAAGITEVGLKSSEWGGDITLTVDIDASGNVTVTDSGYGEGLNSCLEDSTNEEWELPFFSEE